MNRVEHHPGEQRQRNRNRDDDAFRAHRHCLAHSAGLLPSGVVARSLLGLLPTSLLAPSQMSKSLALLETGRFRQAQHNIQVLPRSTAGALAQIVERRDYPRLPSLLIAEDI